MAGSPFQKRLSAQAVTPPVATPVPQPMRAPPLMRPPMAMRPPGAAPTPAGAAKSARVGRRTHPAIWIGFVAGAVLLLAGAGFVLERNLMLGRQREVLAAWATARAPGTTPEQLRSAAVELPECAAGLARRGALPFGAAFRALHDDWHAQARLAPEQLAGWLEAHTRSVLTRLAQPAAIGDDALIEAMRSLRDAIQTGQAVEEIIGRAAVVPPSEVRGGERFAAAKRVAAKEVAELGAVGRFSADVKAQARALLQQTLREIDRANEQLERIPTQEKLREIVGRWQRASETIRQAQERLATRPVFSAEKNKIASAVLRADADKATGLATEIGSRTEATRQRLAGLERAESSFAGTVAVGAMRLGYRAADSKIGQELTVGFKALMLGTRAYYDLFQIDSATNLVAWGGSYKSELEALSRDAERASQMEGTSLVDVARTVEAAVGRK